MRLQALVSCISGSAITVLGMALAPCDLSAQHQHHRPDGAKHGGGHSRQHMDRRFTDPEALAKNFDNPEREAWQMPDRVIADLGLKAGERVADIGAGTGYFSVRLAKLAAKPTVYAVDIEETMVDYLGKRAQEESLSNIKPVLGKPERAMLPDTVDTVLVVNTYHHIADRKAYFRDLAGSIRQGGKLAIVDWNANSSSGPPAEHRFTVAEIRAELEAVGYRFVQQHNYLPRQNYLIFERQ